MNKYEQKSSLKWLVNMDIFRRFIYAYLCNTFHIQVPISFPEFAPANPWISPAELQKNQILF